jgi:hypothetical protein
MQGRDAWPHDHPVTSPAARGVLMDDPAVQQALLPHRHSGSVRAWLIRISYLLCDLDRESVSDLRRWSRELGVHDCEIAEADGMTAVAARLDGGSRGPGLVHIDPFDPDAPGPGGYSALQLAARVANSGTGLVYWYGGAQSRDREQLAAMTGVPLWCGEVTVTGTGGCRAPAPSHSASSWPTCRRIRLVPAKRWGTHSALPTPAP